MYVFVHIYVCNCIDSSVYMCVSIFVCVWVSACLPGKDEGVTPAQTGARAGECNARPAEVGHYISFSSYSRRQLPGGGQI